jgi:alkanesulfonate monooxygenase SsuD/methylene tetrahydromethanopterin reductase-like flavin-dependent oxidoreductase (luciferase family)
VSRGAPPLGVALAWHVLRWEELVEMAQLAEAQGYTALYHDGDVTQLSERIEADVLDGWTVTTALLARTQRIGIGSIRLVQHWNAARLAQAAATAERITPGRLRFFASIGERPEDPCFGYPKLAPAERVVALDETLDAVRALWRGETVTRTGRHVQLAGARVRPTPPRGRLPIEIAGRRTRLLEIVARHADVWNVNLPPIPARIAAAEAQLVAACDRADRDPAGIGRTLWAFTRVQDRPEPSVGLAEFRRLNPWFAALPDEEIGPSLVVGSPAACREQLRWMHEELRIDLPIVDLSGADVETVRRTLEALPAGS